MWFKIITLDLLPMKTLQFKTNINCSNCVRAVTNFLNEVDGIQKWQVETNNPDKILTVNGDTLQATTIIEVVEEAGFDCELINT